MGLSHLLTVELPSESMDSPSLIGILFLDLSKEAPILTEASLVSHGFSMAIARREARLRTAGSPATT